VKCNIPFVKTLRNADVVKDGQMLDKFTKTDSTRMWTNGNC